MTLKTFFTPKYKIFVHLIALSATIMSIVLTIEGCARKEWIGSLCIIDIARTVLFNVTIYFLALVLFPLLLKDWKKYIKGAIVFLIIYSIAFGWISAVSLGVWDNSKGIFSSMSLQYIDFKLIFRAFLTIIPMGILAWFYFLFVTDSEKLKVLFFRRNTERTVNIIVVGLIIIYVFIMPQGNSWEPFLFTMLFTAFFYINTFFVVPILLKYKRSAKFFVASFVWFSTLYCLFFLIPYSYSGPFRERFLEIYFEPYYIFRIFVLAFAPTYLLSFIYGYIRFKIKNQDKKLGAKESELQLLKSQVNPHFLFNTLNTLYATALEENAPKTAESTAKLANLIRYMQEDIDKDFIPLENEIKYLQDYIAIQKLRCAVEPKIETNFENIANKVISPGLLIPFVENAFKYGIDPSKPSKLVVSVICEESTIYFECVNSFNDDFKTYYKEQGFGIGIKNAKQRLELVYPKKHSFEVEKENNTFSVKINITTKQ